MDLMAFSQVILLERVYKWEEHCGVDGICSSNLASSNLA